MGDCWDATGVNPGSHVPGIDAGGRRRVLFLGGSTSNRVLRLGGGTRPVLVLTLATFVTFRPPHAVPAGHLQFGAPASWWPSCSLSFPFIFPFLFVSPDVHRPYAGGHLHGRLLYLHGLLGPLVGAKLN